MNTRKICGTCKYHRKEQIDDGWVCINDASYNYTDWTGYSDSCEDWVER